MKRNITTALFALASVLVFAQEDTSSAKELHEVVITGQYKPQSLKNSVYQVRTVSNERIRLSGATNVQQVLNNQLGIRFFNDNTLGTTDVELMGMSGRNVKILLDGVPLVDRGDTRESLSQIDINTIDRIEIVEGPMSVMYGSDALAGVINLITKKQGKERFSIQAKVQEETAGSEYHPFSYKGVHYQSLNTTWQNNGWNITAGLAHNDADGFGGDEWGRQKSWRPKEQWLGHARVGYRGQKYSVYYRVDGLSEDISARGKINFNTYKAVDQRFITDRYTHQLQHEWRINERADLSGIIAFTDYQRKTKTVRHDFTTGNEELTTGAGEQDLAKLNSFVFRPVLRYKISEMVSIQPGIDINHEKTSGQRIAGTPSITDYAVFVSSEIKPSARINIRPGIRFIKNSIYDAPPAIPSINTKFVLTRNLDLRLAYAYGFRAPALRELYFIFRDANHDIEGNPNLKAEHSNSFTGSLTWTRSGIGKTQFVTTLTGFYNSFENQINIAQSAPGSSLYTYFNIDKFKTAGGTVEGKLSCKDLSATLGFSYIGRYNYLYGDTLFKANDLPQFVWTPEITSNIIYNLKRAGTSIALFYKFTGTRPGYEVFINSTTGEDEVGLTKTSHFHWADLTINQVVFKNFNVSAGIKNLFDVTNLSNITSNGGGAHGGGPAIPVAYGRSYFLGLAFQWNR